MNPLDELREKLVIAREEWPKETCGGERNGIDDALEVLAEFEREHPGLKDFTHHCQNCGRPYAPPGGIVYYWWGNKGACSCVVLCPDCAKEAES